MLYSVVGSVWLCLPLKAMWIGGFTHHNGEKVNLLSEYSLLCKANEWTFKVKLGFDVGQTDFEHLVQNVYLLLFIYLFIYLFKIFNSFEFTNIVKSL